MKSLVTGGVGFIGSNLVDRLITLGHEVVVIDNESAECNEKFYWNDESQNHKFDICDYENTRQLYEGVDYVFHLAAESRLQPAIENPIYAIQNNCTGTAVVLQCAREAEVRRFVYSSTSSGYGNNPYPNVETQKDDCLNPYSVSKITGEKLCKMYSDLYGLETVSLRYFNVFGERCPSKGQYAPVIAVFDRQKTAGEPLSIVGDGEQRRDFIYAKDVARANFLAATMPIIKNKNGEFVDYSGEVFNVGSGINYSVNEIAEAVSCGMCEFVYLPKREGEAETTLANVDKIKEVFGWVPEFDVIKWIKK